jgi:hypothetical protein
MRRARLGQWRATPSASFGATRIGGCDTRGKGLLKAFEKGLAKKQLRLMTSKNKERGDTEGVLEYGVWGVEAFTFFNIKVRAAFLN